MLNHGDRERTEKERQRNTFCAKEIQRRIGGSKMHRRCLAVLCLLPALLAAAVHAEERYGPGVTDTKIRLGQTMPYSGPTSAYGTYGKPQAAFFRMINA